MYPVPNPGRKFNTTAIQPEEAARISLDENFAKEFKVLSSFRLPRSSYFYKFLVIEETNGDNPPLQRIELDAELRKSRSLTE